jgi:Acetyltransferase (GNAT) domain
MTTEFLAHDALSIKAITPAIWDKLFPGNLEDHAYFSACETAVPDDFRFAVRTVFRGTELVAACPTFISKYTVDLAEVTGLDGLARKFGAASAMKLPINIRGFGSPMTEHCPLGILPSLTDDDRTQAVSALLTHRDDTLARRWNNFDVVKDVTPEMLRWLKPIAVELGFAVVTNLPTAQLNIDFADEASYLKSLSHSMQKYIKHRMKRSADIDVEVRRDVNGLAAEVHRLYVGQQAAAATDSGIFDGISPLLWTTLSDAVDIDTVFFFYRLEGELIGFAMGLVHGDVCNIKYMGMQQPVARDKNIYFLNWMTIIRFCLDRSVKVLEVGQNSYNVKIQLGCRLRRSFILLRHSKPSFNAIVRHAGGVLAFDRMDAELMAMGDKATYADESPGCMFEAGRASRFSL